MASRIFDKVLIPFPSGRLKRFLALGELCLLPVFARRDAICRSRPGHLQDRIDPGRRHPPLVCFCPHHYRTDFCRCLFSSGVRSVVIPAPRRGRQSRAAPGLRQQSSGTRLDRGPGTDRLGSILCHGASHSIGPDAISPPGAVQVTAVGHQFWWEFRYPALGVVTANELHVPVSDRANPTPTFVKLISADTDHSFWVPQLAGKTDLIPNRINSIWIDPHETGMFVGQCAQYCGTQHAKMLLRVYVDSPEQFAAWVSAQKQPASVSDSVAAGRKIFETTACINCHKISGTIANGRFGPDLTHLMSRDTIASGAASNTRENLKEWIHSPDTIKPGSLMPAMNLSDADLESVTAYLESLK